MSSASRTAPLCVLVGPPGAGKTTVGRLVAQRLGVGFRDTDEDVVATAGKSIPDLFVDDGEPAFRALEAAAVAAALREHAGVLAVGGGAVHDDGTRAALVAAGRSGTAVVRLLVALHDATKRVGWGPGRPMLDLNPRARLGQLMAAREPLYAEVAAHAVDTTDRTPDDVADEVAAVVRGLGSTSAPASA